MLTSHHPNQLLYPARGGWITRDAIHFSPVEQFFVGKLLKCRTVLPLPQPVPELPEVETVCRGLNAVTLHQPITGGKVWLDRTIATPDSADQFLVGVTGTTLAQWQRRGKYLLGRLERDRQAAGWLGVHLRMTGQLRWVPPTEAVDRHCRVQLYLAGSDRELRFVDQRTFGRMWWVPPAVAVEQGIPGLQALGVEPLTPEFTPQYLATRLRGRDRPIKNALLDQRLIAGIGNIYADESLFLSQIHPLTPGSRLSSKQIHALHQAIVQVLTTSIESGGTTFSTFQNVHGVNGNYGGLALVYQRAGQPCLTCGTPIERLRLAGRSAHYCPQCQPLRQRRDRRPATGSG